MNIFLVINIGLTIKGRPTNKKGMEGNIELAKNETMGNIVRCVHGIVHINYMGVSLHFTQLTFMSFAQMIEEARSRLLDEWLADTG